MDFFERNVLNVVSLQGKVLFILLKSKTSSEMVLRATKKQGVDEILKEKTRFKVRKGSNHEEMRNMEENK